MEPTKRSNSVVDSKEDGVGCEQSVRWKTILIKQRVRRSKFRVDD
jgi:hypothetical protein